MAASRQIDTSMTESLKMKPTLLLLLVIVLFFAQSVQCLAAEPPNIVLIFVDDMGYGDLGCYGNEKNKTPNIDQLAASGQRWTSFYASGSTCVPSRRGLMTGRHPALMGKSNLVQSRDKMMASVLQSHGYATAILGKWHLAGYPKDFTTSPMHPLECGFDYHFGTPGSNDVPKPEGRVQNRELFDTCDKFTFQVPLIRGRKVVEFPANQELFTKRYTQEAVSWIEKHRDERFFLYVAHNMPHAPVFASSEFQGKSNGGRFGDVVEEIDWSVGQVLAALKTAGIEKETLVVFTSDNGPWTMFGPHAGVAGPLRGEKGTSWEGGFRVPGIFSWPGTIAPGEVDEMGANLDLHATFASLTNPMSGQNKTLQDAKQQAGYQSLDLSGVLLRGEASPRSDWYFSGSGIAYRNGDFKIHLSTKKRSSNPDTRKREAIAKHDPPLLFDLSKDVGESNNIADAHPDVVARLLSEMNAMKNQ